MASTPIPSRPAAGSVPYEGDNLLDRASNRSTLEHHYRHIERRERGILARRLPLTGGDVLSIGSGWYPGRHLFPAPAFRLVAADADPACVKSVLADGTADEAIAGLAGKLELESASFDVVLYRLVLHHLVYQGPIAPCFAEAARLLRPGGAMVAVEPGLWHPIGAGLALANAAGMATRLHGTPDDVPLSPRRLIGEARAAGLAPELHAVSYGWRRLAPAIQRALARLDRLGSRPRLAPLGHTVMLIARAPKAPVS